MIEITNEKMEKLYKMQTTLVKSYTTISAIVIFVVLVITRLLRAVSSATMPHSVLFSWLSLRQTLSDISS